MSEQYPNIYYEKLARMIVSAPVIPMNKEEVCFYQGQAESYKFITTTHKTPKKKTSLLITPWVLGVRRKKSVEVREKTRKEYYKGQLVITNMRMVFRCKVNGFDLPLTSLKSVNRYSNGLEIEAKKKYNILTNDATDATDATRIVEIFDLMNKAQTPAMAKQESGNKCASRTATRNENYAVAAFVHYCEFSAKPIGKKTDYPSYFATDFYVNDPVKYHQQVINDGYLVQAPVTELLRQLKVTQLKEVLAKNNLSEKGKKDELIQRIVDEVDENSLDLIKAYVPSEKGMAHLKKYDYLFRVKEYGITFSEFEAERAQYSSNVRTNDIIWRILNNRFNESNIKRAYGQARNTLLDKAKLLSKEGKYTDALFNYMLVLYYDMSGCRNGGYIEEKEDLFLAPGITRAICELGEYYSEDMPERCYQRYPLPHHYIDVKAFEGLILQILNDESVDLWEIVNN